MGKEKRTELISFRLTPSEKEQLRRVLQEHGLRNVSEFVRSVLLTGKYRIKNSECTKTKSDLLYHLAKIGTNMNQIAKRTNLAGDVDGQVLEELVKIRRLLKVLTGIE